MKTFKIPKELVTSYSSIEVSLDGKGIVSYDEKDREDFHFKWKIQEDEVQWAYPNDEIWQPWGGRSEMKSKIHSLIMAFIFENSLIVDGEDNE